MPIVVISCSNPETTVLPGGESGSLHPFLYSSRMARHDLFGVLCMLVIYHFGCVLSENVATGTEYTFKPGIKGRFKTIDWRYKGDLVVEWESSAPVQSNVIWYRFQSRARLNNETGELSLNLTMEDSGLFECHYQLGEIVKIYGITIKVFDVVPEPQVTCQQNDENVTLECSVNPSMPANFTWRGPNGLSRVGKSLLITRKPNDADAVYYCTASNEVSKKTAEVKLQLCEETPESKTNVGALVAGLLVVVIFVLVVIGAAVYLKRTRGGKAAAATSPDPSRHAQDPNTSVLLAPRDTANDRIENMNGMEEDNPIN